MTPMPTFSLFGLNLKSPLAPTTTLGLCVVGSSAVLNGQWLV